MKYSKKLILVIAILLGVKCTTSIDDTDYATIEDEENVIEEIKAIPTGKILWPFPLSKSNKSDSYDMLKSNDKVKDMVRNGKTFWPSNSRLSEINYKTYSQDTREKRKYWSYPQSPIADMMLQTVAINYNPVNPGDPFDFLRDSYPLPKGYSQVLDVYDYVVIGAGSAGAVLAARLTENKPKAMVLVLEAGKPEMLLSDIPALVPYMKSTDYVWPYTMEPQHGICSGSEEQRCYSPRGKAVGGTSVVDYMVYSRGRPEDWNRIAADGNYGWSFNEILQYYKKSEKADLKKYKNSPYHGREGDLTVENVPFKTGLVEAFLDAGRRYGHPTVDYNAPDQLGFGYVQTITNKGHRQSSAKTFLHPHKRRKNLHILSEATATKILIDNQSKRAYGVQYQKNGVKYIVRIRREVILSAGPIASPQLLMLSGIGPRQHLQSLGIPVIHDLQVGRTLYDHIGFPGVIFKLNTNNASLLEPKVATLPNLIQWMQYGDGLLTTPGSIEAIGYLKTKVSNDPQLVPDIELINLGASITLDSGGATRKCFRISEATYNSAFASLNGFDTWSVIPALLHPQSKGYLELRDTNPFSHPKIYANYYTNSNDLATMKEAIKQIIQLGESEPFRKYAPRLHLGQYPSCITLAPGSDSYWECALKTVLISLHNPIGTCKMGPPNDPEAVVDPELRVYGIEGLRVVDSSIIPKTLSTHTSTASEIMIGEKAADMIINTWTNVIPNSL